MTTLRLFLVSALLSAAAAGTAQEPPQTDAPRIPGFTASASDRERGIEAKLVGQPNEPIRVTEERKPVEMTELVQHDVKVSQRHYRLLQSHQ